MAIRDRLQHRDQEGHQGQRPDLHDHGDLVFNATGFLEDTLADLQKKVAASKGDLKDLKIDPGREVRGRIQPRWSTYTRVRGEKQNEFEDERQYLFRRNGALYVWTERANRAVQSAAGPAFSSARSAITLLGKDLSRVPKTFPDEGIKYNLPPDWEYDVPKKSDKPNSVGPIMILETAATVKGQSWRVGVQLFAGKDNRTLEEMQAAAKEDAARNFGDVKDVDIKEKQSFNGEKSFFLEFTAVGDPNRPPEGQPRMRVRWVYAKRKGFRISWLETGPAETTPAIEAALKKARDGLGLALIIGGGRAVPAIPPPLPRRLRAPAGSGARLRNSPRSAAGRRRRR